MLLPWLICVQSHTQPHTAWLTSIVSSHLFLQAFRCSWDRLSGQRKELPFGGIILLRPVNLSQEYGHTKWGLPYNLIIDLSQNECSASSTGWDRLSLTRRHKTTNTASLIAGVEMMFQIRMALLIPLWRKRMNISMMTLRLMLRLRINYLLQPKCHPLKVDCQVMIRCSLWRLGKQTMQSLSLIETIIDLNIVSIHGNTPFDSMPWIKVTSPAPPFPDPHTTAAVPWVKLKALNKAKILRGAEVKIIPFFSSVLHYTSHRPCAFL